MEQNQTTPVRWGILGTGRIARVFCNTLHALPQAEIYAVGSRSREKAESFCQEQGAAVCYGTYEEFVKDEKIDIVYVATPIGSHYQDVKRCLTVGRNVLCEKAFTQTSEEARELYALAQEKGLFLMEAMWTKFQPVYRKMMEWKQQGKLGQIQGVEARFYTCATKEHRLMKDKNHGGALLDLTIYPMMYACSFLGYEPQCINAMAAKGGDGADVMDSLQFSYSDGSFATLTGGLACQRQVSLYVHGTKGRVLLEQEYFYKAQKAALIDWDNQLIEEFDGTFTVDGYEYEALEAMDCIRSGRTESALAPMEETIKLIQLMETCKNQWS